MCAVTNSLYRASSVFVDSSIESIIVADLTVEPAGIGTPWKRTPKYWAPWPVASLASSRSEEPWYSMPSMRSGADCASSTSSMPCSTRMTAVPGIWPSGQVTGAQYETSRCGPYGGSTDVHHWSFLFAPSKDSKVRSAQLLPPPSLLIDWSPSLPGLQSKASMPSMMNAIELPGLQPPMSTIS